MDAYRVEEGTFSPGLLNSSTPYWALAFGMVIQGTYNRLNGKIENRYHVGRQIHDILYIITALKVG